MENFLRLVGNSQTQVIDEERLKFFTSQVFIWDHFSMHKSSYQSLSVDEKTAPPRECYSDLDMKFYGKEPGKIFYLFSEDLRFIFACFWFVTTCLLFIFLIVYIYDLLKL